MATTSKLTFRDLAEIRDQAVRRFNGYPYRARLLGMTTDLDDSDKRALAFFEASIEILNRMGVLDVTKLHEAAPHVYTEVQEVNDEQTYGQTFTPHKSDPAY